MNYLNSISENIRTFHSQEQKKMRGQRGLLSLLICTAFASGDAAALSPEQAVGEVIVDACSNFVGVGVGGERDFELSAQSVRPLEVGYLFESDSCFDLYGEGEASAAELDEAYRQIAPEELAAASKVGITTGVKHQRTIGQHLAGVRQGDQAQGQVAFNTNAISLALVGGNGGGASADAASKLGFFATGTAGQGDRDLSVQESAYEFDTASLIAGLDYRISDEFVSGGAISYTDTSIDFKDAGGGIALQGYSFSLFGSYYRSYKTYVDGIISYHQHDYDSTRNINFTGLGSSVEESAHGSSDSSVLAMSIGAGHEVLSKQSLTGTFLGRLDYLKSSVDGFQEQGAASWDLNVQEQTLEAVIASIGGQLVYTKSYAWGVFAPQVNLTWEHDFSGEAVLIRGNFKADQNSTTFAFESDELDRDYARLALGASFITAGGLTSVVQYETTLGKAHLSEHYLSASVRYEFR